MAWAEARFTSHEVRELGARVFDGWVVNERVLSATVSGDGPAVAEADVAPVRLDAWLAGDLRSGDAAGLTGDDSITSRSERSPDHRRCAALCTPGPAAG